MIASELGRDFLEGIIGMLEALEKSIQNRDFKEVLVDDNDGAV